MLPLVLPYEKKQSASKEFLVSRENQRTPRFRKPTRLGQTSSFQALFGRPPPSIPPYSKGSTSIQALDEALSERDALLRSLKENLRQAQHRMIKKANAHRHEAQFAVGDQVLVKPQPYCSSSEA